MATNSEETTVSKKGTFIYYPHIDKFKVGENFLSKYECRIFPKLDGSNCQINYDITKCKLNFGSRNRALTVEDDMSNFMGKFSKNKNINDFFAMSNNQNLTLFGEYMINNLKSKISKNQYKPEYSKAFIIFDVAREGHYLDYDEYKILLDMFNLEYVEPLAFNDNQTIYELVASFKSKYVNENGKDEGIVIKRKGEIPFNEHRMCKLISEEWTQVRIEKVKSKIESNQIDNNVLSELKATYCTNSYINKELGKIFPKPISEDYKEDVANFGRGKVIQHIMKDFTRIELAVLKGTENERFIKHLNNCLAQKLLDLF
jgi:hypothetical protein